MSAIAYIAIRDDSDLGTGTATDPYNGSTDTLLDNLLANLNGSQTSITADMTLVFGPGVFRTKGWSEDGPVWTVQNRQRFVGSGMHSTILQLVKITPSG